jgi:hypothetical protein
LASLQASLRGRSRGNCHPGELGRALAKAGFERRRDWHKSADGFERFGTRSLESAAPSGVNRPGKWRLSRGYRHTKSHRATRLFPSMSCATSRATRRPLASGGPHPLPAGGSRSLHYRRSNSSRLGPRTFLFQKCLETASPTVMIVVSHAARPTPLSHCGQLTVRPCEVIVTQPTRCMVPQNVPACPAPDRIGFVDFFQLAEAVFVFVRAGRPPSQIYVRIV